VQLWFNLPAAEKMKRANHRPALAADIPGVTLVGGAVAGTFAGKTGPFAGIAAHPLCLDVHLPAGTTVTLPAPLGETAFAYLYRGQAVFGADAGAESVGAARLVVFCDGDGAQAAASGEGEARFLFVSARPLREPVLQYRSLVMNTIEEMKQALDDLEQGTFASRHACCYALCLPQS